MPQPPAELTPTAADVDRLIAAQHPSFRGPLRAVAAGWDNEVFRLGDDLAVRLPRRASAARLIEHEQRWLPALAAVLPVPVPVPLAAGVPGDGFPWCWSIVPWFEGERLLALPVAERDALAVDLAAVLIALHRPAPADAPHNPVRGVPLRDRDDVVRARLTDPTLLALWDDALAAPRWKGAPLWVHGDVHPGNIVVHRGAIAALLDFGDLCAGDPACDLAVAWLAFGAHGRGLFRHALVDGADDRYDDAMWRRARGWASAMATLVADADDPGLREMSAFALGELRAEA